MDNEVLRQRIQINVPNILELRKDLEMLEADKSKRYVEFERSQVACDEVKAKLEAAESELLEVFKQAKLKRASSDDFVAERKRNAKPTVTVIDASLVPETWIIPKPKVDKQGIQAHHAKTGEVPDGIMVEYNHYLYIIQK